MATGSFRTLRTKAREERLPNSSSSWRGGPRRRFGFWGASGASSQSRFPWAFPDGPMRPATDQNRPGDSAQAPWCRPRPVLVIYSSFCSIVGMRQTIGGSIPRHRRQISRAAAGTTRSPAPLIATTIYAMAVRHDHRTAARHITAAPGVRLPLLPSLFAGGRVIDTIPDFTNFRTVST